MSVYKKLCITVLLTIYFIFFFMYIWALLHPSNAFIIYINMFNEKWVEGPLFLITFPGIVKYLGELLFGVDKK